MTSMKTLTPSKSFQTMQETEYENVETSSPRRQPPTGEKRYNSFFGLVLHILVISLSSFYFGYIMAYLSAVDFGTIMKIYPITMQKELVQGLLVACIPIGGGLGALISGYCIHKLSRRNNLILINLIAVIAGLVIYIPRIEVLFVARVFQGICAGFFSSLAPLMMKQLSPTEISGTLTSFNQIMIATGVLSAFVFSLVLSIVFNDYSSQRTWWLIFGFPMGVAIFQSFLLVCVYPFQTPKYLFQNGEQKKGRQLVERIYRARYVESVIRQIKLDLGLEVIERTNNGDKSEVFTLSVNEVSSNSSHHTQHADRATPRTAVLVAIHLAALQQFCGINAVIAYGGEIVGGKNATLKLSLPILINLEQVIGAVFASYLLTVIGRKSLLQMGSGMSCVGCGIIAAGFFLSKTVPGVSIVLIVFGMVLFMANFGLTLGPVVWVYLPEIVQPNVLPYATMINWASAAAIMLLFPILKKKLPDQNPALLFLFFAIWSTLSFFFNKKFVIETQNKGERQIFQEYQLGRQIREI